MTVSDPDPRPLALYGQESSLPPPDWPWVERELERAGTYWLVARSPAHPHPRPLWAVWHERALFASIGSPVLVRQIENDPIVTLHLDSGTDVVIVEGRAAGPSADPAVVDKYNVKYDWCYSVEEYGPLITIVPSTVIAWRSAEWAGQGGFQQAGRWRLDER